VVATFRQPFGLLAETTAIATRAAAENSPNSAKNEIWLRMQSSSNQSPGLNSLLTGKLTGNFVKSGPLV
jgi:hypothetical protein